MRTTDTWLIRAISNLHPGSGDADFGIIDKHVQRDAITNLPTIYASSIKGALREIFDTTSALKGHVLDVFGSDTQASTLQQGGYRFYDAQLLAIPARSNKQFYYLATCPAILQDFIQHLQRHSNPQSGLIKAHLEPFMTLSDQLKKPYYLGSDQGTIQVETSNAEYVGSRIEVENIDKITKLFGLDRIVILPNDGLKNLCDSLPTVARNHLDNGISQNLWYEEIVPRETRFYCAISRPSGNQDLENSLVNQLGNLVQIGANATVGYGLSEIKKIPTL